MVMDLVNLLHKNKFLGTIFHTLDDCLQRELRDCEKVLDLGCGPSSPVQYCDWVKYSVGVEAYMPYLRESKRKRIHDKYLNKKIEELRFKENEFDAVIMIEVLEHLPKRLGLEIIKKARKWARKKVVISCPNGYLPQKALDNNPLQQHLSGWKVSEMRGLGFKVRGLAGIKFLRQEVQDHTMGDDMLTTIKFRPQIFWFMVASLSQMMVYYFPEWAFEIFSVRRVKSE
jgi:SAM-dependent methyltransferase